MLNSADVSSCRVPAADQMVPGSAALRPAHSGADLRPPLDEERGGVAQVARGARGGRNPPQNHRHGLFVKHKLEQGKPLSTALMGLSGLYEEIKGRWGWKEGTDKAFCPPRTVSGHVLHSSGPERKQQEIRILSFFFLFCREFLIYFCWLHFILFVPIPPFFVSIQFIILVSKWGTFCCLGGLTSTIYFPSLSLYY